MQNSSEQIQEKKNIFTDFVRQTNPHIRSAFVSGSCIGLSSKNPSKAVQKSECCDNCTQTVKSRSVASDSFRSTQNALTQTNFKSSTSINLRSPRKYFVFRESCTQTSKTVLSYDLEERKKENKVRSSRLSPDSLSPRSRYSPEKKETSPANSGISLSTSDQLHFRRKNHISSLLSSNDEPCDFKSGNILTKTYLEKKRGKEHQQSNPSSFIQINRKRIPKSQSFVERKCDIESCRNASNRFKVKSIKEKKLSEDNTHPVKFFTQASLKSCFQNSESTNNNVIATIEAPQQFRAKRSYSFMSPTLSSENKDERQKIEFLKNLISPIRKGKVSPRSEQPASETDSVTRKVPYIDGSEATILTASVPTEEANNQQVVLSNSSNEDMTTTLEPSTSRLSISCELIQSINRLKQDDWNIALRGLAEIVEICRLVEPEMVLTQMTTINQRILELLKSPRSHVCRTACQAIGHLFEYVKDTRRPEFDEIVDTLLSKTADSNKFIRQDSNLSLDCMVTHMPILHTVRAICNKGPDHKNPLVRTAAARLVVCAVVIAGPVNILKPQHNEYTRKRIIINMVKFINDRCSEVRRYGERLFKLLHKDMIFDLYLERYLDKEVILKLKRHFKNCYSPR